MGLDGITQGNLRPIADFSAKHRLPSIYPAKAYAQVSGLLASGSSDAHLYHRAAAFVDNLKTAKALGLTIPPSLLQRADQVIE